MSKRSWENVPSSTKGVDVTDYSENGLKKTFAWLTRNGMGRHFPGMPIGWYQMHQMHAIDRLIRWGLGVTARPTHFTVSKGNLYVRAGRGWQLVPVSPRTIFEEADTLCRR